MIRYSSFNYVALLHSLLANVSAHRSREWGTIAAVVQRRLPWLIVSSRHVLCFVCGLPKICKLGPVPIFTTGSEPRPIKVTRAAAATISGEQKAIENEKKNR